MQKKDNHSSTGFGVSDLKALGLGTAAGLAALCLGSLVFAALMLYGLLPAKMLSLYAGIIMTLSGAAASMIIGPRGRMLLFVPAALILLLGCIYLLGQLIFGGSFWEGSAALLLTAQLFGLSLGSAIMNLR